MLLIAFAAYRLRRRKGLSTAEIWLINICRALVRKGTLRALERVGAAQPRARHEGGGGERQNLVPHGDKRELGVLAAGAGGVGGVVGEEFTRCGFRLT